MGVGAQAFGALMRMLSRVAGGVFFTALENSVQIGTVQLST